MPSPPTMILSSVQDRPDQTISVKSYLRDTIPVLSHHAPPPNLTCGVSYLSIFPVHTPHSLEVNILRYVHSFTVICASDRAKIHILGGVNAGSPLVSTADGVDVNRFGSVDAGSSCFLTRWMDGWMGWRSACLGGV